MREPPKKVRKILWQSVYLLDYLILNLEDEIHLKGGRIVTP